MVSSLLKNVFRNALLLMCTIMLGCAPNIVMAYSFPITAEDVVSSTVEVTDGSAFWSGVVIDRDSENLYILSVLHDSMALRESILSGNTQFIVRLNGVESLLAELIKWDYCTELALFIVPDNDVKKHKYIRIAKKDPMIGSKLKTAGNAMALGIQYNEGILGAKNTRIGLCTNWHIYTGGVVSGQTGSPVLNSRNQLVGMITAVAMTQAAIFDPNPTIVFVPVYHIGYIIPISTIKGFLISLE